jgi:hypothetical protein
MRGHCADHTGGPAHRSFNAFNEFDDGFGPVGIIADDFE